MRLCISVSSRVIQKQPLPFKDNILTVKMLRPQRPQPIPPGSIEKDHLAFSNLPVECGPLSAYITKAAGTCVSELIFGLKPDVVLVRFDDIPGM